MNLMPSMFYSKKMQQLNILWQAALFLTAFLMINIVLYFVDSRVLGDEKLWMKPLKFEVSVIIHLLTLAFLGSLLNDKKRKSRAWKIWSYAVVIAGIFEVMYIFLQAARGRESHFNKTTVLESLMYGLMGLGALTLVLSSFYLGFMLYQEYRKKRHDPILLSSALGLIIGSFLTLVIAGYLSSTANGLMVSNIQETTLRMPLFGWYLNGQDLRIPHFLATHMMQLIPLYGFYLSRKNINRNTNETCIFWVVGTYSIVVISLFSVYFFAT